jgi:iron(III) transport system permease protein
VAFSTLPQSFVVFTSFRATRGPLFIEGFSLDSYRQVFRTLGLAIRNTYIFGLIAIVFIVIIAMLIAYLTVRKKSFATNLLDSVAMIPFFISGSVIGIVLILAFNAPPLLLIGTPTIMILAFIIRRLPYTLRSSSAILHQISPSLEEAAISLGDSPMKSFFKVTALIMMPGVISGAVLSWITIINELNASILLFNVHTQTMPVVIYNAVHRGSGFGPASALASILILSTVAALILFFKLTGKKEISL